MKRLLEAFGPTFFIGSGLAGMAVFRNMLARWICATIAGIAIVEYVNWKTS